MRYVSPVHFATAVGAAFALAVLPAASAAAATASYEDGVFRYREQPKESVEHLDLSLEDGGMGARLRVTTSAAVDAGPGCAGPTAYPFSFEVVCAVAAPGTARQAPRYRLSLSDRRNRVFISPFEAGNSRLRGVIYSGRGEDSVGGAVWRVYGGIGNDSLDGRRVYGGPDDDFIEGVFIGDFSDSVKTESDAPNVLRGGTGDDIVSAFPDPGLVYGGPGSDVLKDSRGRNMLVGGPGDDTINLYFAHDSSRDVVRVRGGGRDLIDCFEAPDREDVFFVDAADHLVDCGTARIELTVGRGSSRSATPARDTQGLTTGKVDGG